jgi:hypothetical protein
MKKFTTRLTTSLVVIGTLLLPAATARKMQA